MCHPVGAPYVAPTTQPWSHTGDTHTDQPDAGALERVTTAFQQAPPIERWSPLPGIRRPRGRSRQRRGSRRQRLRQHGRRFGQRRTMGQRGSDRLVGEGGRDIVEGWEGSDRLIGGGGADLFVDGPLDDTSKDEILSGGDGDDAFFVDNVPATKDTVACGNGFDRVAADAKDVVAPDCERVRRGPNAGFNLNAELEAEGLPFIIFEGLA